MFAFPRIEIPLQAQKEARERGMEPDEFYCLQLVEETGTLAFYLPIFQWSTHISICFLFLFG